LVSIAGIVLGTMEALLAKNIATFFASGLREDLAAGGSGGTNRTQTMAR
jgi:hypothetical protein